jgi:hypothetical protein
MATVNAAIIVASSNFGAAEEVWELLTLLLALSGRKVGAPLNFFPLRHLNSGISHEEQEVARRI